MSVRSERIKRRVKRSLKQVPKEELQKVVEEVIDEADSELDEIVFPKGAQPGDVINGFKVGWTESELNKRFPIVKFIPEETIPITWNGIRYQCFAQVEMHVPEPVKEIYDRHRREQARATVNLEADGFVPIINLGAGALEPPKG